MTKVTMGDTSLRTSAIRGPIIMSQHVGQGVLLNLTPPPFLSVALAGVEHEGWMEERIHLFPLSVFLLQWWKHHKLPVTAQRLGPRTLFLPPPTCYCG